MNLFKRCIVIVLICISILSGTACGDANRQGETKAAEDAAVSAILSQEIRTRIYYLDADKEGLIGEDRLLSLGPAEEAGLAIMKALIAGPSEEEDLSVIPRDTRLLDVRVENGVCSVDLSREFQINHEGTELLEKLTIYAIVNSLTECSEIDKVQILIEGKQVETYKSYLSLDHLLERDESLIR